jgi:hypothetical protein
VVADLMIQYLNLATGNPSFLASISIKSAKQHPVWLSSTDAWEET